MITLFTPNENLSANQFCRGGNVYSSYELIFTVNEPISILGTKRPDLRPEIQMGVAGVIVDDTIQQFWIQGKGKNTSGKYEYAIVV